jgi:hypothetical protein
MPVRSKYMHEQRRMFVPSNISTLLTLEKRGMASPRLRTSAASQGDVVVDFANKCQHRSPTCSQIYSWRNCHCVATILSPFLVSLFDVGKVDQSGRVETVTALSILFVLDFIAAF